jgi:hypothetical protein
MLNSNYLTDRRNKEPGQFQRYEIPELSGEKVNLLLQTNNVKNLLKRLTGNQWQEIQTDMVFLH